MQPMGGSAPSGILNGDGQGLQGQGQGLSLTLGTQVPSGIQMASGLQYRNPNSGFSFLSPHASDASFGEDENSLNKHSMNDEYMSNNFSQDSTKVDPSLFGMSSVARTIPHSKYLKVTQLLLEEVVNVRKALKRPESEKKQNLDELRMKNGTESSPSNPQDSSSGNSSFELSPAEKQDLQNKLTKLLSILDEVDRRYKQYYRQMQIVVSSFDMIAGCGAAKPYTALALQTISRHFRCLRDAITGQIHATRRSLGDQDPSAPNKGVGISRLRYVDQQLRQQRALQQLGMMQQHTWRPQRGLPESSVSILRAWLFEHFLHPYPNDSDKIMLARQTGLTRSQVSNWFINARVRLWKPMVEEMYKEENGDAEMDSNSSSENTSKASKGEPKALEDKGQDIQQSTTSTSTNRCAAEHIPSSEISVSITGAAFQNETQVESETEYGEMKRRGHQRGGTNDCGLYPGGIVQAGGGPEGLAATATSYQMPELARFGNGNGGVSLTLGLQHCDGAGLPMAGAHHQGFVMMRGDDILDAASTAGPESGHFDGIDAIDQGNHQQHRYSSSQLLHDFVA